MNKTDIDQNKMLFLNMVSMLTISTMQQLGKVVNPATGKAESNLEAAQATIDLLDMLEAKTVGNLDQDEARALKDTLTNLKLNYVETRKNSAQPEEKKTATEQAPPPATEHKAPANAESPAAGDDQKSPKYHKTYG